MEIVRIFFKRNLGESSRGIEAVTGVEFREDGPEHPVLKRGQDLVADPFVGGHPALARGSFVDHPGPKNRVGFVIQEGSKQFRQLLWCVLAVAVEAGWDAA